jgi:hypothetical protein
LTWDYKTFKDFKLWTWLQATKALDLPISEQAETWLNYFSIESNQIKAKELLDPFRKEKQKEFDFLLQEEYNIVFPTASHISSVFGSLYLQEIPSKILRSTKPFRTPGLLL